LARSVSVMTDHECIMKVFQLIILLFYKGLGPNTHFGIKYKYNSAKSNSNILLFPDFTSNISNFFSIQIDCNF